MYLTSATFLALLLRFPFGIATSTLDLGLDSEKVLALANCKKLSTDADWPSKDVWKSIFPGIDPRMPNEKLKHPDYTYDAKTIEDVQNAVKFAAKHNIRINVINSGHDFIGRNDAPSGILVRVGAMKGVRVLESFTPTAQGAKPVHFKTTTNVIKPLPGNQAAVTFGAGVNSNQLNRDLRKSGLYTVGAAHGDVSVAGGWSQGGGHALLSSEYGLGADNVLEYKLITADGNLTVANAVTNRDLFWALRGGGTGWGVVVESTFKAYPAPKILPYNFWLNTTDYNDRKSIFPAVAYLCSQLPRLNLEGGMQGFFYVHPNAVQANFVAPNAFANSTKMAELWDPILKKIVSMPGFDQKSLIKVAPRDMRNLTSLLGSLGSFLPKSTNGASPKLSPRHSPGKSGIMPMGLIDMDSRLLGREHLNHPGLADALEKAMPNMQDGQLRCHLTAGGKVMKVGNDTSVLPAWRKTFLHVVASGIGTPVAQSLRDLAPDMGAYVNEAWIKNPDWKNTFWGTNYPKLSKIKSKWDPNMVFYVTPGINADKMVVKEGRLCMAGSSAIQTPEGMAPVGDNLNVATVSRSPVSFPMLWQGAGLPAVPGMRSSSLLGAIPTLPKARPS